MPTLLSLPKRCTVEWETTRPCGSGTGVDARSPNSPACLSPENRFEASPLVGSNYQLERSGHRRREIKGRQRPLSSGEAAAASSASTSSPLQLAALVLLAASAQTGARSADRLRAPPTGALLYLQQTAMPAAARNRRRPSTTRRMRNARPAGSSSGAYACENSKADGRVRLTRRGFAFLAAARYRRRVITSLHPPGFIEPCLPTVARIVPTGRKWAYEIK